MACEPDLVQPAPFRSNRSLASAYALGMVGHAAPQLHTVVVSGPMHVLTYGSGLTLATFPPCAFSRGKVLRWSRAAVAQGEGGQNCPQGEGGGGIGV